MFAMPQTTNEEQTCKAAAVEQKKYWKESIYHTQPLTAQKIEQLIDRQQASSLEGL
jgi:hypothetical protein